jgi:hypothetical protein
MKIAYIISAHKQPDLLLRLLDRLNGAGVYFFVHVDKRTDQRLFDQIVSGCAHLSNVHLLERHPCYWGDFGHVQATLKGINEIFKRNTSFDYAILLTGQDYPIKTNEQIHEFFERNGEKSFMAHFSLPTREWSHGGLERVERWHVRLFGRHFMFPMRDGFFIKRRIPMRFQLFGGSSYWCLSRECMEYLHRFIHENAKFVNFFKYADVPDEIFFQTILMNSPYASKIVNDDMRYIEWKDPDAGSPSVLGAADFPKLADSEKLFARKFDVQVDVSILDRIDHEILKIENSAVTRE